MSPPKLFQPFRVGNNLDLKHRVVFAPSTRYRADDKHVPNDIIAEYYSQRSSIPGTLIISEGTFPAPELGGIPYVPGIWSNEQIDAWKQITDVVHANGSFMFMQLWALGRSAIPEQLEKDALGSTYHSSSGIPLSGRAIAPTPLTVEQIKHIVSLYAKAASNAIKAGFDGVEIHACNGYLHDQFIQDMANDRRDEYGGSIENRCRFSLEVMQAVVDAVGENRAAIRFTPWSAFQDMLMEDPKPTFSYLVKELRDRHPNLAYLHLVEPRGDVARLIVENEDAPPEAFSNQCLFDIWGDRPVVSCGYGYNQKAAMDAAEKNSGHLISFTRAFISNPDLPFRLERNLPLAKADRAMFYPANGPDPKGYTDYPFSPEFVSARHKANVGEKRPDTDGLAH